MRSIIAIIIIIMSLSVVNAFPTSQTSIYLYNISNSSNITTIDHFAITKFINETWNYSKNYDDVQIFIDHKIFGLDDYLIINKSAYYYSPKPKYYFKAQDINIKTSKKRGIAYLNIYTNYPSNITITDQNHFFTKAELTAVGNISIPLSYYLFNNITAEGKLQINITSPIQKLVEVNYSITLNETNKPIILSTLYPKKTIAGDEFQITIIAYEDTRLTKAEITDIKENKTYKLTGIAGRLTATIKPKTYGTHKLQIYLEDIFKNNATRTIKVEVEPRETIIIPDILLISLKKDHEYLTPLFRVEEPITVRFRLANETWKPENSTKPILLIKADDTYKELTKSWKALTGKSFYLSITAYSYGTYEAVLEANLPSEYKAEKNKAKIYFKVENETIEQNITFDFGSFSVMCHLTEDAKEYVCETHIPAERNIREKGIFISRDEIENLRNYYESKIELEQFRKKVYATLFALLLLTFIIVIAVKYGKSVYEKTRLRWW